MLGEVFDVRAGVLMGSVGVGIKLTQKEQDLPPDAVSPAQIASEPMPDYEPMREQIAAGFVSELKEILNLDSEKLIELFEPHCADIGKERSYRVTDEEITGIVQGIDAGGALIVGERLITHDEVARTAFHSDGLEEITRLSARPE